VRRLSAEELFDAVSQATGFFPDIPVAGTDVRVRYVMQTRSSNDLNGRYAEVGRFLGNFGQSNRSRNVRSLKGTIPQAALMMNSKVIKEKVEARPGGRLHQLLHQDGLTNDQLVEELFLAALSRLPTTQERALAVKQIQDYRTQGAEDVMWALVNKLDFLFNY
jgi:hypothetical protein